jgi:glucose/arabinose dehydrogenase
MTDRMKFPNAVRAVWSSGDFTEATSGGTIVQGTQWKAWNQALMVAVQKNQKVIVLEFNKDLGLRRKTEILKGSLGRIRTVVQGTDGNLYVLTDNGGGQDKIVRLTPQ